MNTCYNVDCVQYMSQITQRFADLIIADPPFNIGFKYDIYSDNLEEKHYLDWCETWIRLCIEKCLKPTGNLLICIGDEYVSRLDILCQDRFNLKRKDWLVWHYTFGQSGTIKTRKKFTRSKTHILRFTLNDNATFDATKIAVPSARQLKYKDKRANATGKCPNDVLIFKRIAGTHKERVDGMPTQMPYELIKTFISSMCPPSGTVFSPFCGSGIDLVVAKDLGMNYVGCELSTSYHKLIMDRLGQSPSTPASLI